MATEREHIEDLATEAVEAAAVAGAVAEPALAEAAAEAVVDAENAAASYRAKAEATKQDLKKSWITFLRTGIIVLALVAIFLLTLAWFVNSKSVTGTGMSAQAEAPEDNLVIENYYLYKYSADEKKGIQVDALKATLDGFDVIFQSRNKDMAVVLRIPVSGDIITDKQSFKITFTCEDGDYLVADATSGSNVVNNKISNVVGFKCACISTLDTKITNEDTGDYADLPDMIYQEATSYLEDSSSSGVQSGAFVSGVTTSSYSSATKSQSIVFTIPAGYTLASDGKLYLYVEINYDDTLATAFFNSRQSTSSLYVNMDLDNDMKNISLSEVA